MPKSTTLTQEDTQIRQRMDSLTQALRAKEIDALMAHYAPDMVTFDLRPPLQLQSADAYRKNFEAWFASVQGPIDFEIRDLRITMRDDIAFCHYLAHVKSTRITGENADYWVRATSGFQKMNGQWMITHEHISVPLYMETLQGALDLQP
jgi:ketosteroid isomerase-like protein